MDPPAKRGLGYTMRRAARLHLWAGLLAGPGLLVLGLSGGALVWAPELDAAFNGTPTVSGASARGGSLDAIVAVARFAYPGGEPRALRAPAGPERPWRVELDVQGHRLDVAVDPSTLRVLDSRAPERSIMAAVRSLHGAFHAGRAGALAVGLCGLWLGVVSLTGLWLYGPRVTWPTRATHRALHRVVGAVSMAFGLVVGVTGAVLALAAAFPGASAPPLGGALAHLDFVAARAQQALPGARITALVVEAPRFVRVDTRGPDGRAGSVVVGTEAGEVVPVSAVPPPDRWDVVRRLHAGDFGGWASRLLYAAVGLALPVLAITGVLIALRRRA
jgi:hypothetical protein